MGDSRVTTSTTESWFEDGTLALESTNKEVGTSDVGEAEEWLKA